MKMTLKDNVLYTDNEAAKILGVPVETIKEWRYFGLDGLRIDSHRSYGYEFKRALLHLDDPDYLKFRVFSLNLRRVSDAMQWLNREFSFWEQDPELCNVGGLKLVIDKYIRVLKECFGTNEAFENWRYEASNLPTPDELLKRYDDICEIADKLPK